MEVLPANEGHSCGYRTTSDLNKVWKIRGYHKWNRKPKKSLKYCLQIAIAIKDKQTERTQAANIESGKYRRSNTGESDPPTKRKGGEGARANQKPHRRASTTRERKKKRQEETEERKERNEKRVSPREKHEFRHRLRSRCKTESHGAGLKQEKRRRRGKTLFFWSL